VPEGRIYDVAECYRKALLDMERTAALEIIDAYRAAYERIQTTLAELLVSYDEARRAGASAAELAGLRLAIIRANALEDQVIAEMRRFGDTADYVVTDAQLRAVQIGLAGARELTEAVLGPNAGLIMGSFNYVPTEAMMDLVGFTHNGSPLRILFDALGADVSLAARQTLLTGMALGYNPRKVADEMQRAAGIGLDRALLISRTETIRAHREATRRSYAANKHIIRGWIWHSAADVRTCAACWAMHGTVHRPEEELYDHPNGRCVALPQTFTWEELGFAGVPESGVVVESGADKFAELDAADQRMVLGPSKYAAYQAGAIGLQDLVGIRESAVWGRSLYERSLTGFLGPDKAAQFMLRRLAN